MVLSVNVVPVNIYYLSNMYFRRFLFLFIVLFICKFDLFIFFYISFHMCFSQVNELDPVCCNLNCILVVSYLNITLVSHIY